MTLKCIYNKKGLKDAQFGICYSCLETFKKEDITLDSKEDMKCPSCKKRALLPVTKNDLVTQFWIASLNDLLYNKK